MKQTNEQPSSAFKRLASFYEVETPEDAIKVACQQLLEHCEIKTAPVPLKGIGALLGLQRIVYRDYSRPATMTSVLRRAHNGYEIWLSNQDLANWRRSRFTVAHEIGH